MSNEPSDKDLTRVRAVVVKAIDLLALPDISPLPETDDTTPGEVVQVPIMMKGVGPDGQPFIGLRFLDDGVPVIEAIYHPVIVAASFLKDARSEWTWRAKHYDAKEEQLEEVIFETAVDMLVMMLQKLHRRMNVAMESLTLETLEEWNSRQSAYEESQLRARGVKVRLKDTKFRSDILEGQNKAIREVWGWTRGGSDKLVVVTLEQKKQFASEYQKLFSHWEEIRHSYRRIKQQTWRAHDSWRTHAKVDCEDTPDDLLDEFETSEPNQLSYFAMEHAARRTGIRKTDDLDPKTVELRQRGVAASGCSRATLFNILKEGQELLSPGQKPE